MPRVILHVDMDAFYAAIEEREDPALRGRPVVVGADPRQGRGRGVVAAANYEARRYGIHSAMPISRAWRLCPDATWLRPRPELYAAVSRRIFGILRRYTDLVEPLSIDEAFLDVTGSVALFGDGEAIARSIRSEVREAEGLTASVGVATSKFVAKLASDLEKPDGLVVVPPGGEPEFLAPLEVRRLWGAGPKALEAFRRLGVSTIGQVAELEPGRLVEAFGAARGRHLHRLACGVDERAVEPEAERKSLGREHTFAEDVADRAEVRRALLGLCEEVARRLRARGLAGSTVTVKLRFEGFETVTRRCTLSRPVRTTERIWLAARGLLGRCDRPRARVRLVGVYVSGLRTEDEGQLTLFRGKPDAPDERVAAAVDRVVERFGEGAVTRAALLREAPDDRRSAADPSTGR